jgi:hypothetical protein
MGKSEIAAVEVKSDGSTSDLGRVLLTSLFVDQNKSCIVMDQRWLEVLKSSWKRLGTTSPGRRHHSGKAENPTPTGAREDEARLGGLGGIPHGSNASSSGKSRLQIS